MAGKEGEQKKALVGLISRLDYGSKGFRKGLVDTIFKTLQQEGTHYNILVGGLISKKAIVESMKIYVKDAVRKDKVRDVKYRNWKRFEGLLSGELLQARKRELENHFLASVAKNLSSIIPVIQIPDPENSKKAKTVDLFITTSPAFDGELGERVASMLADLRPDIRVWNSGGDRFPVLYVDKLIWALAPEKAVWMRGDYYSTAAERVIKDKIKRTTQGSPDVYVVGGFGSSINKPKGELRYAYVTIPGGNRFEETRVNENQIGLAVLEFPNKNEQYLKRTYNFKDLVSCELEFIVPPSNVTALQRKMIDIMKRSGWATPGTFKYELNMPLEHIVEEIDRLARKKTFRRVGENWPGIHHDKFSKKYYFNLPWIQRWLKYELPEGKWQEDRILSFSCLHAGSIETDYEFFVREVPKIILSTGATIFVDAGDTKEGMEHNLDKKGELIAGMNDHKIQEEFAAKLISSVIFKVFKERFGGLTKNTDAKNLTEDKLKELINHSLLQFYYILGNHDLWDASYGHRPLVVFHKELESLLIESIEQLLTPYNVSCSFLMPLVKNKIVRQQFFTLPSGLQVSVQHPFMARAKTTSLRPQEMLDFGKRSGCQVTIGGNFHTSEAVEEWDMDLGQCVCVQNGTIKHGSNFERSKMKTVDQGVGYVRILSQNQKIWMTETAFYGEPHPKSPVDNLSIINKFVEVLDIPLLKHI